MWISKTDFFELYTIFSDSRNQRPNLISVFFRLGRLVIIFQELQICKSIVEMYKHSTNKRRNFTGVSSEYGLMNGFQELQNPVTVYNILKELKSNPNIDVYPLDYMNDPGTTQNAYI